MQIRTFEEILDFSDEAIKLILRNVDAKFLAKALTASSEKLKEKIFRNLSEAALKDIKEQMDYMGPSSPIDEFVLEVQCQIRDVVNELFPSRLLIDDAGPDEWA